MVFNVFIDKEQIININSVKLRFDLIALKYTSDPLNFQHNQKLYIAVFGTYIEVYIIDLCIYIK